MVLKNFFDEFLFPKTMILNRPGIIINKSIRKFGGKSARTRIIYHFGEIETKLYLETKRIFGNEKTNLLWYKIGKDIGTRYFLFLKREKIPDILMPLVLKHIFNTFAAVGLNFAEKINYDHKEKSLVTSGKNCIICKNINTGHMVAGLTSGVLSSLNRKNIEAEPHCKNCPNNCGITANPTIKKKYIPDFEKLKPIKNYDKLNFPQEKFFASSKFKSFSDFLKFQKVRIDKKQNVFYFKNKIIIPSEMGFLGIILKNYFEDNKKELLKKSVIKTSEEIMKNILKHEKTIQDKIKTLCALISAFGWGLPYHRKINNKIIFKFLYPPINNKNDSLFKALILNGHLNCVYNKKFEIVHLTDSQMEFVY